jgi:hypothetical protein
MQGALEGALASLGEHPGAGDVARFVAGHVPHRIAHSEEPVSAPARTQPPREAGNATRASLADEARLRTMVDVYAARLDDVRREVAREANVDRLWAIGEFEIRLARATGTALAILAYRTWRPRLVTPASELAMLHAAIDSGAATITEQYGEVLAVVPGEATGALRERLADQPFAAGQAAVADVGDGDSFDALLEQATRRITLDEPPPENAVPTPRDGPTDSPPGGSGVREEALRRVVEGQARMVDELRAAIDRESAPLGVRGDRSQVAGPLVLREPHRLLGLARYFERRLRGTGGVVVGVRMSGAWPLALPLRACDVVGREPERDAITILSFDPPSELRAELRRVGAGGAVAEFSSGSVEGMAHWFAGVTGLARP